MSDYMEKKHRFRTIPMANAHADILLWQQEASTKFPGHCDIEFPKVPHLMFHCTLNVLLIVHIGGRRVRFTIMLLDCSLYPSGTVQYRLQLIFLNVSAIDFFCLHVGDAAPASFVCDRQRSLVGDGGCH